MPYIAGQRLTIAGTYREPGESVPEAEAEHWPTLNDLVATGHLVWVDEPTVTEPEPIPTVYRPPQSAPTEPGPQDEAVVAEQEAQDREAERALAAQILAEPSAKPPRNRSRSRKRTR